MSTCLLCIPHILLEISPFSLASGCKQSSYSTIQYHTYCTGLVSFLICLTSRTMLDALRIPSPYLIAPHTQCSKNPHLNLGKNNKNHIVSYCLHIAIRFTLQRRTWPASHKNVPRARCPKSDSANCLNEEKEYF